MNKMRIAVSVMTLSVVAACQSVPSRNNDIEQAREALRTAGAESSVVAIAGIELERARALLQRADAAWSAQHDDTEAVHNAYLVRQRVAIATAVAAHGVAAARIDSVSAEREALRLEARTTQAQLAEERARAANAQAQRSQEQAQIAQSAAVGARQDATQAEQQTRAANALAVQAEQQRRAAEAATATARLQVDAATNEARRLESELEKLAAKRTERGLVVTLQDVLFEVDQSDLKPGALRTMDQIAQVLRDHPTHSIAVEGFTDSSGPAPYNLALSERRANSVKIALVKQGVVPDRVTVRSFGEAYPVADNTSAPGRQLNRRVEILFSDAQGKLGAR